MHCLIVAERLEHGIDPIIVSDYIPSSILSMFTLLLGLGNISCVMPIY